MPRRTTCRLRGGLGTLLAVSVAVAVPAAARADVQRLGVPVADSIAPAVAANARGDAVVAFHARSGGLYVAFAARGRRFARPKRVPGSALGDFPDPPQVAVDERGNAVVAWTVSDESIPEGSRDIRDEGCCHRVHAFVRRRSGRLTRVRTLSSPGRSASLRGVGAGGGRFGVLWWSFTEVAEDVRAAVAGRGGSFSARVGLAGLLVPAGITVSRRRVVIHAVQRRRRAPDRLHAFSYRGRGLHRGRTRRLRSRRSVFLAEDFAANARGDVLALATGSRLGRAVSGRVGGRLRAVEYRGAGAVALARSGRGVLATATGHRQVTIRSRRRDGRFGSPRRRTVLPKGTIRVTDAAINDRGRIAVALYRGPFESDPRSLLVLIDGRPRAVRRARGGDFALSPVHVDARGRVRVIFVAGGQVRAWRG